MADDGKPVVLVVDDDRDLADMYGESLRGDFEVRTAYGGEEALAAVDEDVTVVLLDRRMPDRSGDEVLEELRSRGFDGQVVMLTAVSPDYDVLEMGFDDYVVKPVSPSDVMEVVSRMVSLDDESDAHQEFSALVSKKLALESKKGAAELQSSEEYDALLDAIAERRRAIGQEEATRLMAEASAAVFGGLDVAEEDLPPLDLDAADGSAGTEASSDEPGVDDASPEDDGHGQGSTAVDEPAGATARYATLREENGLYGTLLEGLPDPVFVVGPDRNVIDCNPAFSDRFGYTPEEVNGTPVSTLYAGGAPPSAGGGGDGPVTAQYETSDGSTFTGETTIIRFREGGTTIANAAVVRPL